MKSALFVGEVEHRRFAPVKNEFTYSVCYYFIDLDEVESLFRFPFLFSYNFPGILSFWRKDYLGDKKKALKDEVIQSIKDKTGKSFEGSVRILTNISYFGYCFNPVTFYYCYDKHEKLSFIVSQVTNTPWGERHIDVLEVTEAKEKNVFKFAKEFHVSPFMPMEIDYTWVFNNPQEDIYVYMQNRNTGTAPVVFDSTMKLKKREFTAFNVLKYFVLFPFNTFKTSAAIYYQAGILYFIKRTPFYTHPKKKEKTA